MYFYLTITYHINSDIVKKDEYGSTYTKTDDIKYEKARIKELKLIK